MITRERFEKFFEPKFITEPNCGCWLWTACCRDGYGMFSLNRVMISAHRVSFVYFGNSLKKEDILDHLCRVKCCVNPDHLEVVTNQENVRRGALLKTHCPQGHPYSGDNLYLYKGKHRMCKECSRERNRKSKESRAFLEKMESGK